MRNDERRKRRMRIRYSNRGKCLLCYLIAFALPLLWQLASLGWIYPYKLAATAPKLPFELIQPQDTAYRSILLAQEKSWLLLLAVCALVLWILTLLLQLGWRSSCLRTVQAFRTMQRAVRTYRLMMLIVWCMCLAAAYGLWELGVRLIPGRTLWDYAAYFGFYLLLPLAAMTVSRLAAPSAISGRRAFFKRL